MQLTANAAPSVFDGLSQVEEMTGTLTTRYETFIFIFSTSHRQGGYAHQYLSFVECTAAKLGGSFLGKRVPSQALVRLSPLLPSREMGYAVCVYIR